MRGPVLFVVTRFSGSGRGKALRDDESLIYTATR
jgi:hypothetical protein